MDGFEMPYTIDDILSDPLITVEDRYDDMGNFAIRIGALTTDVFIELGRFRTGATTKFRVSHSIHTPEQDAPYRTSLPIADYWEAALNRAVDGLLFYYRMAVRSGHLPQESWLVEN